jgi:excisionase family DNA binding protein
VALPASGRPATGPTPSPQRLCSIDEAAEHLGVSVRFVRRLVAERRIRHMKVGRYVRFDRTDLDAFVAAGVREALWP